MAQLVKQPKRTELTLMMEILKNAVMPVKKTNLLYKTRINFQQLEKYLELLMSKDLLKFISDPFNGYQITKKGVQFMELLDDDKVSTPLTFVVKSKIEKKVKH